LPDIRHRPASAALPARIKRTIIVLNALRKTDVKNMTLEMWITTAILAVAMVLFITEIIRLDLVALGVVASLMLFGIVTVEEGLAGFSNKAVISIGALFIVGGAVFHTGLASVIASRILRAAQGDLTRLLVIMMLAVALMSAFISSTGVMALMLPAVVSLARQLGVGASKLLLPMAYSALLGGALTLIGTPPNLLVSEALRGAGLPPFDFFSFTPLGLLLLGVGVVYMLVFGQRLLPDRKPKTGVQTVVTPHELFAIYELPGSLFRLRVQDDSPLVGQTIAESGLSHEYNLNVLSLERANGDVRPILPLINRAAAHERLHVPPPETTLHASDLLLVQGSAEDIARATGALKLAVLAAEPVVEGDVISNEVGIAEVLLRPRSKLIGKTISELRFSRTYHLTVLALRRPGAENPVSIKHTPIKFGDVLLVQGEWKHIFALKQLREDFIVMGEREALQVGALTRPDKAPITLLIMVAMIALVALNLLDLAPASLLAALAVILTGCIEVDDAYNNIDLKTLFLMAGMLPMSTALAKVGLVDLVAAGFVGALGQGGAVVVMAGLFILTAVVTQVLSNTATAVLIAPLALATAQQLGVQPHAFLMSIGVAASMAFATPIASPVNTLVVSAGSYRFLDYVRVGVPLVILALIVSVIVLPILFPF
jgi:di/tricarboxylate transporter